LANSLTRRNARSFSIHSTSSSKERSLPKAPSRAGQLIVRVDILIGSHAGPNSHIGNGMLLENPRIQIMNF
jgi:hypothetical protein